MLRLTPEKAAAALPEVVAAAVGAAKRGKSASFLAPSWQAIARFG